MYTPSAVSQQLRRLEVEAGQPLLHRQARGVRPTEAELCWVVSPPRPAQLDAARPIWPH